MNEEAECVLDIIDDVVTEFFSAKDYTLFMKPSCIDDSQLYIRFHGLRDKKWKSLSLQQWAYDLFPELL